MVQMSKKISFFSSKKITLVLFFFFSINLFAQLPSNMSNIKSKDISDVQLQEFIKKAAGSGMSEAQIQEEFLKRGMNPTEVTLLRNRINQPSAAPNPISEPRVSNSPNDKATTTYDPTFGGAILGAELFSNPTLSFEPDLRIATPKNYVLGVTDKLLLDVYGVNLSQQSLEISPEGTVNIKYVGPLYINGLTIEEATKRINAKLAKLYPELNSGKTKIQITLTGIKSIKVILVGAVKKQGTYTLSSLATLFNALFVSGGPAENGSYRNIELLRNNKIIQVADLYDFLLKADQKANVGLKDNDVIRIPFAKTKVNIDGQVNRPGIYELQPNETLADVLTFAGGYKSFAYKARITGIRNTDFDKKVIDIVKDSIAFFKPQNGDSYSIGGLIDRFQNRVVINGTVFKPGNYAVEKGITLDQLIKKAEGLREDAYTERVIIIRTREDLTKEYISVNLNTPSGKNLLLQKEDVINISSIFDIKEKFAVTIEGAVRKPGSYGFEDSLSLKSLLLMAGGFADNASGKDIAISRRKRDVEVNNPQSPIVEIIKINDTTDLALFTNDIKLQAFDIISVKVNPYYKPQINVSIAGEVLNPGTYTLQNRSERITDLIKRAGNILYTANLDGAKLIRRNYLSGNDLETIEKIALSGKDSSGTLVSQEKKPYREISIALTNIMNKPGSTEDILLEESDQIIIPMKDNMVSVYGEVFKPITISYETSKKLKSYLHDAGGVTESSNKQNIFVIYPNGKAANIKHTFLFFKKYPKITAGSRIFVPKEEEKKGTDYAKFGLLVTGLSAFITAVALAYQITK
jgi:protein involved in polysaccharide export with SLBB domain